MSTTPARYQANPRLIDQPEKLRELYEDHGLTIREIASNHADVGRTAVGDALKEYGITDGEAEDATMQSSPHSGCRGLAPPHSGGASGTVSPASPSNSGVEWSDVSD